MAPQGTQRRPFASSIRHDDTGTRVRLVGDIDIGTAGRAHWILAVAAQLDRGSVLVDIEGVEFIDAFGLRLFLSLQQRLGDRLVLAHGSSQVQRVFELSGTGPILRFGP